MRRQELERLKENIDLLDPHEQNQVYNIVKKYTTEYTSTTSGVLVPASVLSEECLQEMKTYVSFCQDQKKRMDEDTTTRKKYERLLT
jgi:hypothetical protein